MKILAVFLCVFICLFGLAVMMLVLSKDKEKRLQEQLKQTEAEEAVIVARSEKYVQEKKENEELVQKVNSDNNLDSANATIQLLQKQSDKGHNRNS